MTLAGRARAIRLIVIGALVAASACEPRSSPTGLTTETDSQTITDRDQRLAFLARYLRSKSPIVDAEFVIYYRDNSSGPIPGPSDWDIRAALQLADDGVAWHAGWEPCPASAPAPAWARALLDRRPAWRDPRSPPRCFRDPRHHASIAIAYPDDRLVLYRTSSELTAAE